MPHFVRTIAPCLRTRFGYPDCLGTRTLFSCLGPGVCPDCLLLFHLDPYSVGGVYEAIVIRWLIWVLIELHV